MIGQNISHYCITARISEGSMGTVYRACDVSSDQVVAIKVVKPTAVEQGVRHRFAKEAAAISELDHPNVVRLYEIVTMGDLDFLVMEYVDGPLLRALIDEGMADLDEAFRAGCQLSLGLQQAHSRGVIHRDVKPDNIMINQDGVYKILDFGVARLMDRSSSTRRRRLIGTLPYISPEQIEGASVDHRADVYALGVVLYEMITGRVPFDATEEAALFYQILNVDPPLVTEFAPETPEGLALLVAKSLAKKPEDRQQTMDELHDGLIALGACGPSPSGGWRRWFKRRAES